MPYVECKRFTGLSLSPKGCLRCGYPRSKHRPRARNFKHPKRRVRPVAE